MQFVLLAVSSCMLLHYIALNLFGAFQPRVYLGVGRTFCGVQKRIQHLHVAGVSKRSHQCDTLYIISSYLFYFHNEHLDYQHLPMPSHVTKHPWTSGFPAHAWQSQVPCGGRRYFGWMMLVLDVLEHRKEMKHPFCRT